MSETTADSTARPPLARGLDREELAMAAHLAMETARWPGPWTLAAIGMAQLKEHCRKSRLAPGGI